MAIELEESTVLVETKEKEKFTLAEEKDKVNQANSELNSKLAEVQAQL